MPENRGGKHVAETQNSMRSVATQPVDPSDRLLYGTMLKEYGVAEGYHFEIGSTLLILHDLDVENFDILLRLLLIHPCVLDLVDDV